MRQQFRPYETCFMLLSALLGLGYLTAAPPPGSVAELMPGWVVALWSIGLLASGILGMIGCIRQAIASRADDKQRVAEKLFLGLALERAAITTQTGALLIILGSIVYAWASVPAPFPALGLGFVATWMAANVWRDRQIASEMHQFQLPPDHGE